LKVVCERFKVVLNNSLDVKKGFIQSGGFEKIQQIQCDEKSALYEAIDEINKLYPPEVVNYYSSKFAMKLQDSVDNYDTFA
jgi:hypothetical protein